MRPDQPVSRDKEMLLDPVIDDAVDGIIPGILEQERGGIDR